jgi:hypothetical protein
MSCTAIDLSRCLLSKWIASFSWRRRAVLRPRPGQGNRRAGQKGRRESAVLLAGVAGAPVRVIVWGLICRGIAVVGQSAVDIVAHRAGNRDVMPGSGGAHGRDQDRDGAARDSRPQVHPASSSRNDRATLPSFPLKNRDDVPGKTNGPFPVAAQSWPHCCPAKSDREVKIVLSHGIKGSRKARA